MIAAGQVVLDEGPNQVQQVALAEDHELVEAPAIDAKERIWPAYSQKPDRPTSR